MSITRCASTVVAFALACSGVALAKTTTIAELGSAPLLGSITSTAQLRSDVAQRGVVLADAAQRLGVTPAEYGRFRQAVAKGDAHWVTVPRRLDAMSWRTGSRVHVIRDVEIPAGTHGWQVDLDEGSRMVSLYMPARCGNLSLVVHPIRRVAARLPKPLVAAVAPQPAPVAAPAEVAPPVETPQEVAVQPTPVPRIEAPVYHASRWSPLAIIPILFGFGHGGSGGGGGGSGDTTTTTTNSPGPGCGTPACY